MKEPVDSLEIRLRHLDRPLAEIAEALKSHRPLSGILGVGFGRRRSGKNPAQRVIKVLVAAKAPSPDALPGGAEIPRWLVLKGKFLGATVTRRISTDVVGRPKSHLTQYRIETGSTGAPDDLTAACYAFWTEGGARHWGVVTAAHALWTSPRSGKRKSAVTVHGVGACFGQTFPGRPVCASELDTDGIDVGLVQIDSADGTLDPCFGDILGPAVAVMDEKTLKDELDAADFSAYYPHYVLGGDDVVVEEYWDTFQADLPAWGNPDMLELVRWSGPAGSFVGGVSGAGVLGKVKPAPNGAIGIQSWSPDIAVGDVGYGTSMWRALEWLEGKFGNGIQFSWQRPA